MIGRHEKVGEIFGNVASKVNSVVDRLPSSKQGDEFYITKKQAEIWFSFIASIAEKLDPVDNVNDVLYKLWGVYAAQYQTGSWAVHCSTEMAAVLSGGQPDLLKLQSENLIGRSFVGVVRELTTGHPTLSKFTTGIEDSRVMFQRLMVGRGNDNVLNNALPSDLLRVTGHSEIQAIIRDRLWLAGLATHAFLIEESRPK